MNLIWLLTLADWLVNLSAGWFAAGLAILVTGKKMKKIHKLLFTTNFLFAIVSLALAVKLRGG